MTNYEETAKAYENDYRFAPVGMGVGSFWGGALAAGLVAFFMSCLLSKGVIQGTIKGGQRVVFAEDGRGIQIGLGIAVILLLVAILCGLAGYSATLKKRELKGLWTLSLVVVPFLTAVGTIAAIVVFH